MPRLFLLLHQRGINLCVPEDARFHRRDAGIRVLPVVIPRPIALDMLLIGEAGAVYEDFQAMASDARRLRMIDAVRAVAKSVIS